MSVYGNLLLEQSDYIFEFNIKDTLDTAILKIKKAIISLIDKIQLKLSKCKDSKIKSILQKLLSKARALLSRNIKDMNDAKDVSDEIKDIDNDLNSVEVIPAVKNAVADDDVKRARAAIWSMMLFMKPTAGYAIRGANDTRAEVKKSVSYATDHFGNNLFEYNRSIYSNLKNYTCDKLYDMLRDTFDVRIYSEIMNRTTQAIALQKILLKDKNASEFFIGKKLSIVDCHMNLSNIIFSYDSYKKIISVTVNNIISYMSILFGDDAFDSYPVTKIDQSEWTAEYFDKLMILSASGDCSEEFYKYCADVHDYLVRKHKLKSTF